MFSKIGIFNLGVFFSSSRNCRFFLGYFWNSLKLGVFNLEVFFFSSIRNGCLRVFFCVLLRRYLDSLYFWIHIFNKRVFLGFFGRFLGNFRNWHFFMAFFSFFRHCFGAFFGSFKNKKKNASLATIGCGRIQSSDPTRTRDVFPNRYLSDPQLECYIDSILYCNKKTKRFKYQSGTSRLF